MSELADMEAVAEREKALRERLARGQVRCIECRFVELNQWSPEKGFCGCMKMRSGGGWPGVRRVCSVFEAKA